MPAEGEEEEHDKMPSYLLCFIADFVVSDDSEHRSMMKRAIPL